MTGVRRVGRMRRSTVGLLLAFVAVLAVYLYSRPDPTTVQNSPVYVPPPTSATTGATTPPLVFPTPR